MNGQHPRLIITAAILLVAAFATNLGAKTVSPNISAAQTPDGPAPLVPDLYVSGMANDVFVHETVAYLATGEQVTIVDLSVPGDPEVVGRSEWLGRVSSVVYLDGLVYAATQDGIAIIDVSDPERPELMARAFEGVSFSRLLMTNEHLVGFWKPARGEQDEVWVITLDDPLTPDIFIIQHFVDAWHVAAADGIVFVQNGDQISTFSVSPFRRLAQFPIKTRNMTADGQRLYAVEGVRLYIYDIDPRTGERAARGSTDLELLEREYIFSVHAEGDLLTVLGLLQEDTPVGRTHAVARLYDVSDPSAPRLLSRFEAPETERSSNWRDAAIIDGRMILARWWGGFDTYDVSDRSSPRHLSQSMFPAGVSKMHVDGERLLFSGWGSGLQSIDASTLGGGTRPDSVLAVGDGFDLAVSGDVALMADIGAGARAFRLDGEAPPVELGRTADTTARAVAMERSRMYVANSLPGERADMTVHTLGEPAGLTEAGSVTYDTSAPSSIAVKDGIAFIGMDYLVSRDDGGISVVDARDRFSPFEIDRLDTDRVSDVQIVGNLLYAAVEIDYDDEGNRLIGRMYDVTDPLEPRELGPLSIAFSPDNLRFTNVTVYEDQAWFVGSTYTRTLAFAVDTTSLARPKITGWVELATLSEGLVLDDRWAYAYGDGIARYALPLPLKALPPLTSPLPTNSPLPPIPTRTTEPPPTVPAPTHSPKRWESYLPRLELRR